MRQRLAEAGLAYDQHEPALAYAERAPTPRQQDQFLLAADKAALASSRPGLRPPPLAQTMRKSWTG